MMGVVALSLEFVSLWIFGWLSVIGVILGIIGVCQPIESIGKKTPAIIAIPLGVILSIMWMVALSAVM